MLNDNLVFLIVEQALGRKIDPIDKDLIERESDLEGFGLTVPTNFSILRSAEFFRKNQEQYYMIQLGEYLTFNHLDLDKPFVAYTRNPVEKCSLSGKVIYEMLAYKPE